MLRSQIERLLFLERSEKPVANATRNKDFPTLLHLPVREQSLVNAADSLLFARTALARLLMDHDVRVRILGVAMNAGYPRKALDIQLLHHALHSLTDHFTQPRLSLFFIGTQFVEVCFFN